MSRRRSPVLPVISVAFPAAALIGWADLHEPFHTAGLVALVVPGIFLGLIAPGVAVSATSLPLLLIPSRTIRWWRSGYEGRPHIPNWLRRAVYAADGYRCCYCHSEYGLQLDHVKPWSRGGLTVLWNMMTLCGHCNRVKSNYWVDRNGYVHYRAFANADKASVAASILAYELHHRWHPGRWIRAGWDLAA